MVGEIFLENGSDDIAPPIRAKKLTEVILFCIISEINVLRFIQNSTWYDFLKKMG